MTLFVSRNSIQLASDASGTTGYYNNHKIILTHTDAVGRKVVQTKEIVSYDGGSKIALIDGMWDVEYTPGPGASYEIVPLHADARVSINPAMQTMDYITSRTYGRGLDVYKDLELNSWLNSGRVCDTPSDIYVKLDDSPPSVGAVYNLGNSGVWQGTVAEVVNGYVRFTDIIGKLSYKWNNWRNYPTQAIVYQDDRSYRVTSAGVKATAPTHTSGNVNGLEFLSSLDLIRLSGTGPNGLTIKCDGNPVRYVNEEGVPISGYTLYDADAIDYYRYIGWDSPDQRQVTRHQTNMSIDTSLPLFDNTNSLLQHYGGILRYSGDKYVLEVEDMDDGIADSTNEPRNITPDDIIGKISITDEGVRSSYNSLTVSYSDPANKFEARNISFFNSEFLKADRNVPKKGSLTIPGITNYYNTRIQADKYLARSRYGLSINLNLVPKGVLLLAGKVIQLQYPRYGWVNKRFRIENLTHNDDCSVDITATEYDDSFYVISNVSQAPAVGLAGNPVNTTLSAPEALSATNNVAGNELVSAIVLKWDDVPGADSGNVTTDIYASYSPHLFVDVVEISSGFTFTTTQNPHGLKVGQRVIAMETKNGMIKDKTYYIRAADGPNTFTLSETLMGSTIGSFVNGGVSFRIQTAVQIGQVNSPINSFIDNMFDVSGSRVQKYYWIRYRINQQ